MAVSARWFFNRQGRCWVDQHGTICGCRHVYADYRGVPCRSMHALLGRRRRCYHQRRERQDVRGADNGPSFWGYSDAARYAHLVHTEGSIVQEQQRLLIAFYEEMLGSYYYQPGGVIYSQVRRWF